MVIDNCYIASGVLTWAKCQAVIINEINNDSDSDNEEVSLCKLNNDSDSDIILILI